LEARVRAQRVKLWVRENYCKQRTPLHTSFERSDGMVAIAQRGINSGECEFVPNQDPSMLWERAG